jgi:hypothetical protein
VHLNLIAEFAGTETACAFVQGLQRLAHHMLHEGHAEDGHTQNRQSKIQDDLPAALRNALVRRGQGNVGVQDAEGLDLRRVRMALRGRTRLGVFNWRNHAKRAFSAGQRIGAKRLFSVRVAIRGGADRQLVGNLQILVHRLAHLGRIGGKADAAAIIDDANAHHPRLVGHVGNNVVQAVALVAQHVVGGVALDHAAYTCRIVQGGAFEVPAVQFNIEIAQQAKHNRHRRDQQEQQFRAQAPGDFCP